MMNQASMGGGGGGAGAGGDQPQHDNAEMIYISSLALLKVRDAGLLVLSVLVQPTYRRILVSSPPNLLQMLKHGRAGVPMEVMGLMLGEFVDDYTVTVIDVFAMPQSGTGVSVESVDEVFQTKMLEMLKQTGR